MIPILTRILSTADYGKVNTYTAWMAILAYIMGLALEYSVRNAYVDYKDQFEEYVSSICGASLVNLIVTGTIIFSINKFVFRQGSDLICLFCILHAYVHAVINYYNAKFTMQEQYKKRVALLIIPNLLSSVLGVVLIIGLSTDKYMGRILGYILTFVPLGALLIFLQFKKTKIFYDLAYWKYGLTISLPMIAHGLSTVLLTNSDRIILSKMLGDEATGIYSLVYNCSMVVTAVVLAIENIWIPWFTERMVRREHKKINRAAISYIWLVTITISGVLLISPEIITVVATKEYWSGKEILSPLILSSFVIFLYSLSVGVEIFYKITKNIAINTLVAALLNIVLDIIFIPKYGIKAAAYATLIAYICSFTGHYICARKLNTKIFPLKIYIAPAVSLSIIATINGRLMDNWVLRWSIAIILALAYILIYINKNRKNGAENVKKR